MTTSGTDAVRPRGARGRFTRSVNTAERDAEACRLRTDSVSYPEIARRLGFADESGARKAVERGLARIVQEPAAEMKALALERIHRARRAVLEVLERQHVTVSHGRIVQRRIDWERDADGSILRNADGEPIGVYEDLVDDAPVLAAVDRLVKLDEREAKLIGYDAEQKLNLSGGVTYEILGVDPEALR